MKRESIRLSPEKIPSLLQGDYLLLAADAARQRGWLGRRELIHNFNYLPINGNLWLRKFTVRSLPLTMIYLRLCNSRQVSQTSRSRGSSLSVSTSDASKRALYWRQEGVDWGGRITVIWRKFLRNSRKLLQFHSHNELPADFEASHPDGLTEFSIALLQRNPPSCSFYELCYTSHLHFSSASWS